MLQTGVAMAGWMEEFISLPDFMKSGVPELFLEAVCAVFPQDASGDLKLCPATSRLCNFCTFACIILAMFVHFTQEYAETRPAISDSEDPWMRWFLQLTATLAVAGIFYELSMHVTIRCLAKAPHDDPVQATRLRLSMKMLTVFLLLAVCYQCMASDVQRVHKGWLAERYGGHQIVYSVRYIEWVIGAPLVFSISGQLERGPDGKPRNGLIPSALLTGIYCIISWQGLVVKSALVAWLCIIFAFFSFFVASVEQLLFAAYLKDQGSSGHMKGGHLRAGLLVYLVVMVGIYGLVFLCPIRGWISAGAENKFYCIFDASFKLGTSVMLICMYDFAQQEAMRRKAESTVLDLHRLVDTASVPIFGVNQQGQINQWNQKASQLTGMSKEVVLGMPYTHMLGLENANQLIHDSLTGKVTDHLQTTLRMEGSELGKQATLLLSASPMTDNMGAIAGVTLIGCDLTEVEAFKEADVRKARFMAVMSHELRSPLHGIIGLAERLVDDIEDTTHTRMLKMVGSCASRLLDLVVNIMEMASLCQKDSNGRPKALKMQHDLVELPRILEEVLVLVRNSTDKSGHPLVKPGVELVNNLSFLPIIEADAHRCMQIFFNLVTNACKFTQEGTVSVSCRVDPHGTWVEISVTDTGPGIPAESRERIFLPFEQEDTSDTRHYEGVGLGLSIAWEVVKLHGGRISLQSEVGVGTTFAVKLPIVMGAPMAEEEEEAEVAYESSSAWSSQSPEPTARRPRKVKAPRSKPLVLSVDDEEMSQLVIESILKSEYEVHTCMDGHSALEYFASCGDELPDIVLLDVMMPGLSGFELCKSLRSELQLDAATLPILIVSANHLPAALAHGFESGCNDYIMKPFNKDILTSHIKAALSAKTGDEKVAAPSVRRRTSALRS